MNYQNIFILGNLQRALKGKYSHSFTLASNSLHIFSGCYMTEWLAFPPLTNLINITVYLRNMKIHKNFSRFSLPHPRKKIHYLYFSNGEPILPKSLLIPVVSWHSLGKWHITDCFQCYEYTLITTSFIVVIFTYDYSQLVHY